ncbi:MAG TPA: hypothetical protein VGM88_07035 [Kofleriaceae bacterium]|jgi:hypothetical protein
MKWLALLVLGTLASTASAAPPSKLAAAQTQVLGDHLRVSLAAGMKVEPRGHDIMSADQSDEDETRAVGDDGAARFVMMAYELYATPGTDFAASIAADAKDTTPGATPAALGLKAPLVGFGAAPPLKTIEDVNLVYFAWIASPDGSVQALAFYLNPDAAKAKDAYIALAKKIAATAVPGKRVVAIKGGPKTLGDVTLTLPPAWVPSTQQGPDFVVYHLRKMGPLGQATQTCSIYRGGAANWMYRQEEIDEKTVKKDAAPLLGAPSTWMTWTKGTRSTTEAMGKTPGGGTMHVFCSADAATDLPALRAMAATITAK